MKAGTLAVYTNGWQFDCYVCNSKHFMPGSRDIAERSARRHEDWHRSKLPVSIDPAMAEAS